jgi:hypothetical protein
MHKSLTLGGSILRYGLVAAIGVISAFGVIVRYEYDWEVWRSLYQKEYH